MDGLCLLEVLRLLNQLLELLNSRLPRFHSTTDFACLVMDSGQGCIPVSYTHLDYTRKRGIVHSEILLPPNAPSDFQDRGTLWNSVEQIEKACNSQLARELEVALPIELSREEQVRLVRAYCSSQFVSRGMCADFNIHDTGSGNPHAHILLTMRPMDERGKWLPKSKKE